MVEGLYTLPEHFHQGQKPVPGNIMYPFVFFLKDSPLEAVSDSNTPVHSDIMQTCTAGNPKDWKELHRGFLQYTARHSVLQAMSEVPDGQIPKQWLLVVLTIVQAEYLSLSLYCMAE